MEGHYKEFVAEVVKALRDDGHGIAAFGIWATYCAGELNRENSTVIEELAAGGPVATAINLILSEQRQPAALPVRCEHGRRWGMEMWDKRCDCAQVDAAAVAPCDLCGKTDCKRAAASARALGSNDTGLLYAACRAGVECSKRASLRQYIAGPCKRCGRHDCQVSSTAAVAGAMTTEQRHADPEIAVKVDRAWRVAIATCLRHVEAARSATLDRVAGETIAEIRNALMLPLTLAQRAGDERSVEGIVRALDQIGKLDAATRYHADRANLIAETPADVPIQLPAMPMRPDPVAAMPDKLTWQEWARVNRDIFRIYGGPVAMPSHAEWRQAGWHDRPTIEDEKR